MTKRERLEMVISGTINDELIEDCKRELEKLDRAAEKAKLKAREGKTDLDGVGKRVVEIVEESEEPVQIETLIERLDWTESRQKLSAICTSLVREGKIEGVDLRIKGVGVRRGYKRIG